MDFLHAEAQFRQLDWQYRQGQISLDQYRRLLEGLRVTDAWGRTWQMQEQTGQWYMYHEGNWVAATPPGSSTAQPAAVTTRSAPAAPASPAANSRGKPAGKGRSPLVWLGMGGLALGGLCLLGLVAGWFLWQSDTIQLGGGTAQPGDGSQGPVTAQVEFSTSQTLTTAPGSSQTDANGVYFSVPEGAVAPDQQAALTAYQIDSRTAEALEQTYTLQTPFYSAVSQSEVDGVGRAELSFPASGPDARVVAVIDQTYFALMDVVPQDGKLTLNPRLAAQGAAVPGLGQSVHYAVVVPKQAAQSSARRAMPAAEVDPRDCSIPDFEERIINSCRRNSEGSVYLEYLRTLNLTTEQADRMVDEVAATMKRYADLGFSAAKINASNSVHVVVLQGGDPQYSFKTGVIYLPLDAAQTAGQGERFELYHEMAHWIQDEEYIMLFAGATGSGRWWMEVSAENMVMLLDEAAVARNLSTYGTITGNEPLQALQSAPSQWPSDFYVHAQLVKVNLCESAACALNLKSFVDAINNGSYPYDDSSVLAKVNSNLDDYARYLLGTAPQNANSAIPLSGPVQSGAGYGEEINIMKTTKSEFNLTNDGLPPQIQDAEAHGLPATAVQARIEKNGVYPLHITSGRDGRHPGLPAVLKIAPGAPFYYRVDGGAVQYSDGGQEVIIQPIHQTFGLKDVRIVALGRTGSEVFSARVEAVSLEGTWLLKPESMVSSSVVCSGEGETEGDPSGFAHLLVAAGSAMGQYTPDASGAGLTWELVPSRIPPDTSSGDFTYQGSVLITPDDIKLQAGMDIPRKESSQRGTNVMSALGALLPLGMVIAARRRKPPYALALVLVAGTILLTACFGLIIYGDASGDITFTKLEYLGGEEAATYTLNSYPTTTPLWQLSGGQATYQLDIKIEVVTEDLDGNETTTINTCAGSATYNVSAGIYKDVVVQYEE